MNAIASQSTVSMVYSTVSSGGADQRKRHIGICEGNSPVAVQRENNTENVSIWWRHHHTWAGQWQVADYDAVYDWQ